MFMRRAHGIVIALALLAGAAPAAAAQDTVAVGVRATLGAGLPRHVADSLVAFYNAPGTIRFSGRTRIPAGATVAGDVAVLGGPVEVAGTVEGDLVVLNGDVSLAEGARITGDLTVVGGVVTGVELGRVDGLITTYGAVFRYRRTPDGIEYLGSEVEVPEPRRRRRLALPDWTLGESEIFVSARPYNRIEALPIAIGPRITTGGRNPFRFEALLIYRTISGFDPKDKDIGYQVRARQWLFGRRTVWLGAGVQSIVAPIERWQLTNLENSLTLYLFRRDYRDYYQRRGWYSHVGWRSGGFFGSLEYRDEKHTSLAARDPWTILFNKEDEIRPNAAIDPGTLRSLVLTLGLDTRNDEETPWSGWYNQLVLERAVGGSLSGREPDFTHFFLDLRRYLRVSRGAVVAVRLAGGGPLGGGPTPAQREHVIGGAGSLPGYSMLQFDCGARAAPGLGAQPGYGCQRFTLFQAEYRTALDFRFRWDEDRTPDQIGGDVFSVDFHPALVLFYDAGAAWDTDESYWNHLTKSDNWVADLGAGLDFGGLGFYFAYPLVGPGGVEFVLRLTARF
jgi:hypothetical protein